MPMTTVSVSTRNNTDFAVSQDISGWLVLYPYAKFRAVMRPDPLSPVVSYEWVMAENAVGRQGKITIAADIITLSGPAEHFRNYSGDQYYDVRIEDPATGARRVMFGGPVTFDPGETY